MVFVLGAAAGLGGGVWIGGREAGDRALGAASAARHQLAAAVCADAFMTQDDARVALGNLLAVDWARRAEALIEEGWATMPDRQAPDTAVAKLCAAKLGEAYTAVRRNIPLAAPAP